MKKIIPFSSDISFQTKIYEITSISLEHNLQVTKDNMISGEFVISGDYKMNESSLNTEPFIQGIPFDISLDNKYDLDRLKVDIDDFKYEIINEEKLKVDIDVLIEGVELVEELETEYEEITPDVEIEVRNNNEKVDDKMDMISELFLEDEEVESTDTKNIEFNNVIENIKSFEEKYVSYFVHIVRENDNVDSICLKYKITPDLLKDYNNIDNITLGDKLIIPYNQDETI